MHASTSIAVLATLLVALSSCSSPEGFDKRIDAGGDAARVDDADSEVGDVRSGANSTTADAASPRDAIGIDGGSVVCAPTGQACGPSQPCCSGNRCGDDGVCEVLNNCIRAGAFCTRSNADDCCSGRCDGDSCVDGIGGVCNGSPFACLDGARCIDGTCACPPETIRCGDVCVNPMYNPSHCGGCDSACGSEQRCLEGTCECISSSVETCGVQCVSIYSNDNHCGACDVVCAADRECVGTTCECRPPLRQCNGVCMDTSADPTNCGTCGTTCAADEVCDNYDCVCAPGLTRCPDGVCRDLMADDLNCGLCGNECVGNKTCQGGQCLP